MMNALPAYGAYRHFRVDMLSAAIFGGSANIAWPAGVFGGNAAGWSWAGWFWPLSLGTGRDLCYSATANTPRFGWTSAGLLNFAPSGTAVITATTAIPAAKQWIHGAVSVTPLGGGGYDWVIYQFGEVVGSGRAVTGSFITHSAAPQAVLGSGGRMSRQTVWNRAITQTEVRAHYYEGRASGPAADWYMNEGEGTVGEDGVTMLSANRLALTLGSGGLWSAETPKRRIRELQAFGSVLLDGVAGSSLTTATGAVLPQLVGATGITTFAWVRPRMALDATQGCLVAGRSGNTPGTVHIQTGTFNIATFGQAKLAFAETLRSHYLTPNARLRGQWRSVAHSFDPATNMIRSYNNGMKYGTSASSYTGALFGIGTSPPDDYTSFTLGEDPGAGGGSTIPLTGWLGPVRIYDVVLTDSQMRDVHLTGRCSVRPAFEWLLTEGIGTTAASTGKYAATATLAGGVTWSLDQP